MSGWFPEPDAVAGEPRNHGVLAHLVQGRATDLLAEPAEVVTTAAGRAIRAGARWLPDRELGWLVSAAPMYIDRRFEPVDDTVRCTEQLTVVLSAIEDNGRVLSAQHKARLIADVVERAIWEQFLTLCEVDPAEIPPQVSVNSIPSHDSQLARLVRMPDLCVELPEFEQSELFRRYQDRHGVDLDLALLAADVAPLVWTNHGIGLMAAALAGRDVEVRRAATRAITRAPDDFLANQSELIEQLVEHPDEAVRIEFARNVHHFSPATWAVRQATLQQLAFDSAPVRMAFAQAVRDAPNEVRALMGEQLGLAGVRPLLFDNEYTDDEFADDLDLSASGNGPLGDPLDIIDRSPDRVIDRLEAHLRTMWFITPDRAAHLARAASLRIRILAPLAAGRLENPLAPFVDQTLRQIASWPGWFARTDVPLAGWDDVFPERFHPIDHVPHWVPSTARSEYGGAAVEWITSHDQLMDVWGEFGTRPGWELVDPETNLLAVIRDEDSALLVAWEAIEPNWFDEPDWGLAAMVGGSPGLQLLARTMAAEELARGRIQVERDDFGRNLDP